MSKVEVNQISSQCGSTLTIGQSGDTVTLASGASQSGFGRTGTVDWQTSIKTTSFTAVSGEGYFINTTSGAITMTLPASPSVGDIVSLKDYAQTFDTNNLTIGRNSQPIEGQTIDKVLDTESIAATLVYGDATKGWQFVNSNELKNTISYVTATGGTVITCGDFKTHIFTGPGSFCVSCAGNSAGSDTVDYYVVAGGGGGGSWYYGGGGGAGGFRLSNGYCVPSPTTSPLANSTGIPVSVQNYPVTVGAGGSFTTGPGQEGTSGSNSSFSTITSTGGGGGGNNDGPLSGTGKSGGSGGGGAANDNGGAGNTPPVSPSQGNSGGNGNPSPNGPGGGFGGGGGGASAAGSNAGIPGPGGAGGAGSFLADSVIGPTAPSYGTSGPVSSTRYFSGGGGGGGNNTGTSGGSGGDGGGSDGAPNHGGSGGTTNTGGGGGGGSHNSNPNSPDCASAGGSGIVIIRYKFQN